MNKKNYLKKDLKSLYESKQNNKSNKEKVLRLDKDIARVKRDVEQYTATSEKIFTELKKIESYELDVKINEYQKELSCLRIF